MEKTWLAQYSSAVPAQVDVDALPSLVALMDASFEAHRDREAYHFMGRSFSFGEIDDLSRAFAGWLQGTGLRPGDRVAVMLPNVPQFPVVVAGILRAGLVAVNVNPLYTPRELEHQLADSGARAIVVFENFAHVLEAVIARVPAKTVVIAATGDLLGAVKGTIVDWVVRRVKKLVPAYRLDGAVRFGRAIAAGREASFAAPPIGPDDLAVLQYTGGTTGVSKGAMLLHRQLVANVLQCEAWYRPGMARLPESEQLITVCALPLYHIYAFTSIFMLSLRLGGSVILIPNARDLAALLKTLAGRRFNSLPGVNTLFAALLRHPDFGSVDWSHLTIVVGGGMAVQKATAKLWAEKTGVPICEGYGLSETSPVAICNPTDLAAWTGSIGLPVPNTEIRLLDDDGNEVPLGTPGELAVRGPQVMAGYWRRPDETAKVMTADGFMRTGDIATVDEQGWFRIVDRKKDMILVSGFNVYPNEIEDVLTQMPGVLECAAIGVHDEHAGEVVKVIIVRRDETVAEDDVRRWCEANLTGYKRPRIVEFRVELPKTNVGKILRRALRDELAA